jgi:hypothetical protein
LAKHPEGWLPLFLHLPVYDYRFGYKQKIRKNNFSGEEKKRRTSSVKRNT